MTGQGKFNIGIFKVDGEWGWPKWAKMSGSGDQCEFSFSVLGDAFLSLLPKTLLWWTLGRSWNGCAFSWKEGALRPALVYTQGVSLPSEYKWEAMGHLTFHSSPHFLDCVRLDLGN